MRRRSWLPLARLALGIGIVWSACNARAQQGAASSGAPPPTNAAPVTDAVSVEESSNAPAASLENGQIIAKVYLPDAQKGFYRGSRFDWAGVIGSLTYRGHDFYVPWFRARSASVRDYVFQKGGFQDGALIASVNNATGPAEEFNAEGGALGYAAAPPGGQFLKIGVGVLRRPDDAAYSPFRQYTLVDAGKRNNTVKGDRVEFTHEVGEPVSGYAYHYTKTVRLDKTQPVMFIEHELRNTGTRPISTLVYNHNFLNIDGAGTTAGLELRTAFPITLDKAPDPQLAQASGDKIIYRAAPAIDQRIAAKLTGFGATAADNEFHIVDRQRGAGLRISGDRPLARLLLWSIRPVMSIEPFIDMTIAPGESFAWSYRYEFISDIR